MSESALAVEIRSNGGKGVARKLRALGRIPGVLYGPKMEATPVSFVSEHLEQIIHGHAGINALIDITGDAPVGGKRVVVKDTQREPIRGALMHVDLYEIDVTAKIQVSVAVHTVGTCVGVTMDAGILDHVLREIEVECLPEAIPDEIEVDVTDLHTGHAIHVGDITLPAGVELVTNSDLTVVAVVAPKMAEEEVEPVEGEEALEGEAADAAAEEPDDAAKES